MSLAQPPVPERRPSASMELGTNNPFRQRLSTGPPSPSVADHFSFAPSSGRPQSRNPFLDVFDDDNDLDPFPEHSNAHKSNSFGASSTSRPQLVGAAAELFQNLTITDHSQEPFPMNKDRNRMPPPRGQPNGLRSRPPPPPPGHHHSRSSDDSNPQLISIEVFPTKSGPPPRPPQQARPRQAQLPNGRPPVSDRSREFDRDPRRRPRRNSDSSVMDAHEAEQKERERSERRRREQRDQRSKVENGSGSGAARKDERARRDRKKGAPLDVIDKLDVTGIYGVHHDGPFDACNPHRNKKTHKLAPVHAFPADSANNALSGFGPIPKADHSHVFGNRDPEAFHDFTASGRRDSSPGLIDVRPSGPRTQSFDPKAAETIHGDETVGLGTSTFLDGAPASKIAMERTMSETTDDQPQSSNGGGIGGGLQRKKSLAQKIRSISQNRPMGDGSASSGHRRPPPPIKSVTEPRYSPTSSSVPPAKNDRNPFFAEYDNAYDKKGEAIAETGGYKGERVPGSPKRPIKAATTDKGSENGLLKRVRSLSKSKRRND